MSQAITYRDYWHAANDGASKRIWFVLRGQGSDATYHRAKNGLLIRFASCKAADKRADELNQLDGIELEDCEP